MGWAGLGLGCFGSHVAQKRANGFRLSSKSDAVRIVFGERAGFEHATGLEHFLHRFLAFARAFPEGRFGQAPYDQTITSRLRVGRSPPIATNTTLILSQGS